MSLVFQVFGILLPRARLVRSEIFCGVFLNCLGCTPTKYNRWNEERLTPSLQQLKLSRLRLKSRQNHQERLDPCSPPGSMRWHMQASSHAVGRLADGRAGRATQKLITRTRVWSAVHDVGSNHASGQYLCSVQRLKQPKGT